MRKVFFYGHIPCVFTGALATTLTSGGAHGLINSKMVFNINLVTSPKIRPKEIFVLKK